MKIIKTVSLVQLLYRLLGRLTQWEAIDRIYFYFFFCCRARKLIVCVSVVIDFFDAENTRTHKRTDSDHLTLETQSQETWSQNMCFISWKWDGIDDLSSIFPIQSNKSNHNIIPFILKYSWMNEIFIYKDSRSYRIYLLGKWNKWKVVIRKTTKKYKSIRKWRQSCNKNSRYANYLDDMSKNEK